MTIQWPAEKVVNDKQDALNNTNCTVYIVVHFRGSVSSFEWKRVEVFCCCCVFISLLPCCYQRGGGSINQHIFVPVPSQYLYFCACPKPVPVLLCLSQASTCMFVPVSSPYLYFCACPKPVPVFPSAWSVVCSVIYADICVIFFTITI